MYTYSSIQVDREDGAPSIEDVAITLGRLPRLCGASRVWWTYLHYSYTLMELALLENIHYDYDPAEVAAQALIREAHSVVTLLWEPGREFKDEIQERIHEEWNISYPAKDSSMRELIDRAATRAFLAEVESFAPSTMKELPIFGDASFEDCQIVRGIWDRQHSPESTADGYNSEPVLAYMLFFEERNVATLRHRIGYENKRWFQEICRAHLT